MTLDSKKYVYKTKKKSKNNKIITIKLILS